jgi:xanthine dehydrogenase YagS FAD-binding subunit
VHTAGTPGGRDIEIAQFYRTPGTTPQIENVLLPGELIVGISIPLQPAWPKSTYVKVRDRAQFDFALASAAVALDVGDGTIRAARVALGGVATVPWRSPEAEGALTGSPATRATFSRAADAALASARGYGENDYKIVLAKRTLVRALEIVSESA